ncbi:MAG: hypothetical protein IPL61_13055 [Myxococcales bacterium]|nr:hypothetical protein [Myxococcales bacterium]
MKLAHAFALTLILAATGCKKKEDAAGAGSAPAAGTATASGAGSAVAPGAGSAVAAGAGSAVASGSAAPTEAPADGLRLPLGVQKVGDKETKAEDMKMTLTIEAGPGKTVEMQMAKHSEETFEVLAVDGGTKTKIKITYTAETETQTMGGRSKDKPSPIAGKTYVVWREGDDVKATLEDGSAPPAEELAKVVDKEEELGTPDPMDEIIASKVWKVGEKVAFTPDELAKVNARQNPKSDEKKSLEQMELTLVAVEAGVARFDMTMKMAIKNPNGSMSMTVTGAARADTATGHLLEIGGTGPVEGVMGAKVSGTLTMKTVTTY